MALSRDPRKRSRQIANLHAGRSLPGNMNALRHGGYSMVAASRVGATVAELMNLLGDDLPLRGPGGGVPAEDVLALRLLAGCLVRLEDVTNYLTDNGWHNGEGKVRPALDVERRLRREALDLCRELGLTPRARAALGLDLVNVASAEQRLTAHLAEQYGEDE